MCCTVIQIQSWCHIGDYITIWHWFADFPRGTSGRPLRIDSAEGCVIASKLNTFSWIYTFFLIKKITVEKARCKYRERQTVCCETVLVCLPVSWLVSFSKTTNRLSAWAGFRVKLKFSNFMTSACVLEKVRLNVRGIYRK